MTVAVLGGTGRFGRGLSFRFATAGMPVVVGSRTAERGQACAAELARRVPGAAPISGASNVEAAATGDIVVTALPWDYDADDLRRLAPEARGKVVVSCANPIGFDAAGPFQVETGRGSAAERLSDLLPDSRIVGAFHHLSAVTLLDPAGDLSRDDVLVCGDDSAAKTTVRRLCVALTGRQGIDAGPLRMARQIEAFTAVLLSVNRINRCHAGLGLSHAGDRVLHDLPRTA